MTQLTDNCTACGLAAAHSAFTRTQFPTIASPGCRVYVAMGAPTKDEQCAQDVRTASRIRFFVDSLLKLGWRREEIDATFAFGHTLRCPPLDRVKVKGEQRKLCGDYTRADVGYYKPAVVILWGHAEWIPLYQQAKKTDVAYKPIREQRLKFFAEGFADVAHEHWVLTLDDPALVLEQPDRYDLDAWYASLSWIRQLLEPTFRHEPMKRGNYRVVETADEAIAVLDWYATQPEYAFDIETGGGPAATDVYSKKSKILGISLSARPGEAHFVALWHRDRPLADDPRVFAALKRCLTSQSRRIGHNAVSFDAMMFFVKTGIWVTVAWDTMLADGILNENRTSHRLKHLACIYVRDMAGYEDDLDAAFDSKVPDYERDYELHVPFAVLAPYACADADVTLRLQRCQAPLLEAIKAPHHGNSLNFFLNHTMHDAWAAVVVSSNGMLLDTTRRDAFSAEVEALVTKHRADVLGAPCIEQFAVQRAGEEASQGKWFAGDRYIYASYLPAKAGLQPVYDQVNRVELELGAQAKLTAAGVLRKNGSAYVGKVFSEKDIRYRPSATADTAYMLAEVLRLRLGRTTETGRVSVDAKALKEAAKGHEWVAALLRWREVEKIASTYVRPAVQGAYEVADADGVVEQKLGWIRDDGMVHPEFMLTGVDYGSTDDPQKREGTRTGRKSAKRPNSTNFAKHSKLGSRLYSLFVSRYADPRYPFALNEKHAATLWSKMSRDQQAQVKSFVYPGQYGGGAIVQLDYSQLELRILAIVARIRWMLERYAAGADLHSELAMEVFHKTLEEVLANDKFLRFLAKRLWFGPVYGQGKTKLHEYMAEHGATSQIYPGQLIEVDEVAAMLSALYAKMPEFVAFKREVEFAIKTTAEVFTWAGRRRYLPHYFSTSEEIQSYAVRQAINFLIQSLGAECCNYANITMLKEIFRRYAEWCNRPPLMINNVHDCLVIDTPSEHVPTVFAMGKRIMEAPPFPGLRPGECPIPILMDGDAGPSWGELAEIKGDLVSAWT